MVMFSCKEEPIGQQALDSIPPGPVSNVTWEAVAGGAIFKYTLPDDEDLLYVKAVFMLRDGEKNTRVSLYSDTLLIDSFGDTEPKEVKLIAVDRSRNESPAVSLTIIPLPPIVSTIEESLSLLADFGGVHAYWDNPTRADIGVVILQKDHNEEYTPIETIYSSMIVGDGATKGMDTIPGEFAVYIQDRWGNKSETQYHSLTPIYETKFDRLKFNAVYLPGDAGPGAGWVMSNMWDGIRGEQGYSSPGGTGIWPHMVTIDLGVLGLLSRINISQRTGNSNDYIYNEGNPKSFSIWGCETLVTDGEWDSWTKLMDCESIKPSGQPRGINTNEDIDRGRNGEDFTCPPTNPKVRYIRILVTRTWAGGDNFQISELEVYGDNR
ncbi:hypothetical protein AwDysgo_06600 [Bacteroidales bacterium]|nr:hypothetical protein AwDysgo_06600 [Bacteroidales bacterium]